MNTSEIGNLGEIAAIKKFLELGVRVYIPFGDGNVVDLIAEWNNKLYKIQVKTTEKILENSFMCWSITHQNGYHGSRKNYTDEEVDFFVLYCIESESLCLVPYSEIKDLGTVIIRLDSYDGIRKKGMRFEKDYNFENYIK